jgi:hypothetical protein
VFLAMLAEKTLGRHAVLVFWFVFAGNRFVLVYCSTMVVCAVYVGLYLPRWARAWGVA